MRHVGAARHLDLGVVGRELDLEGLRLAGQHRIDIGLQLVDSASPKDLAQLAAFGLAVAAFSAS